MAGLIQKYKMEALTKMDISKLSLNNQYQVNISGITGGLQKYLSINYNLPYQYSFGSGIGIMCSEAALPTSSFATAEVKDNYHGINQQFAHTRIYIESSFQFYVDQDYNVLKFFEGWMDYIAGDNNKSDPTSQSYYRRFNYPMNSATDIGYKCGNLSIIKFEKNHQTGFFNNSASLQYEFINAFPKGMTSVPVQYGGAEVLQVNVQFAYDRYIVK